MALTKTLYIQRGPKQSFTAAQHQTFQPSLFRDRVVKVNKKYVQVVSPCPTTLPCRGLNVISVKEKVKKKKKQIQQSF